MSVTIECPFCHGTVESGEELVGKQARCPFCRETITVQRNNEPAAIPAPASKPKEKERPRDKLNGSLPAAPSQAIARDAANPPEVPAAKEPGGPTGIVLGAAGRLRRKQSLLLILAKSVFRQGNATDVSTIASGLLAAAITWLGYAVIVEPLRGTHVGQLLAERGWVAYATCYFTIWTAVVLSIKFWKIGKQRAGLYYDLLPVNRNVKITPENADLVEHHIRRLPLEPRQSFLINRLLMALENFKARKSVPEVGAVLNAQADTDAARVDASYAMLKVLIWAIPILGFIGTVIGISDAVNHFTGAVQSAGDIKEVKKALEGVTQGLAIAFDTTLLGLILSMAIMFPTGWVQKAEEDLLSSIDQYCNEYLMPRLATAADATGGERGPTVGAGEMLQAQWQALQEWQKRLENLEATLLGKVVGSLAEVREQLARSKPVHEKSATP